MFDWVQKVADWLIFDILGMNAKSHMAAALNFFIYDTIKILTLLFVIIFFMGVVNSYFPIDRVKNYLSRNKLYGSEYLMASLFGVVTPFCSCSSVPLFIGFVRGGIPLGVTFSFLITSPLVNEVAIGLFVGLFGVKTTVFVPNTTPADAIAKIEEHAAEVIVKGDVWDETDEYASAFSDKNQRISAVYLSFLLTQGTRNLIGGCVVFRGVFV